MITDRIGLILGNSVVFLNEAVFFIDRPSGLARTTGRLSWRVSEKKYSTKANKAEEIASLNMGLGTKTLPSIFSADLSKKYRKFL